MALRVMFWAALHPGLETAVPIDYEGGWCVRKYTLPSVGNGTMIHQLCSHSHSHYSNSYADKNVLLQFVTRITFVKFVYL
jgi:hypothetical protein